MVGTATITAQGTRSQSTRARGGDFYLATSGDLDLATSGDFFMATDKEEAVSDGHGGCHGSSSSPATINRDRIVSP